MNKWNSEALPANTDVDRRVKKQISRGINYGEYVFAYAKRHGFAWFGFGFALAIVLISIDSRFNGFSYETGDKMIMPFVLGVVFGAPVFSLALMYRRAQYDAWVEKTVELENEQSKVKPPVQTKIQPWIPQNGDKKTTSIKIGKYAIAPEKMGEWADVILARDDLAVVRDDIPAGIFDNVTTLWRRRDIQSELIRMGWAEWTNASQGSIKLNEAGVTYFDQFESPPTP